MQIVQPQPPNRTFQPSRSPQPSEPTEPSRASRPSKPTEPSRASRPPKPTKPSRASQSSKPTEPSRTSMIYLTVNNRRQVQVPLCTTFAELGQLLNDEFGYNIGRICYADPSNPGLVLNLSDQEDCEYLKRRASEGVELKVYCVQDLVMGKQSRWGVVSLVILLRFFPFVLFFLFLFVVAIMDVSTMGKLLSFILRTSLSEKNA
ncbi:hypothetical protein BC938DRAFT_480933 [Jimgerdemannia flammicorona]|uniref:PB1 domain-containing protein n=1 Tax=Jimgerdemannia flammicorona TaxID=994334 RepID=A0A433QH83_9FUNG|nr:hypothetical protein BC938DRAFT_480933 [Jimgerdemannia flammicorona]